MGGIHPHDMKHLAKEMEITNAIIPPLSVIPMSQHIGSPAECLVQKGDEVTEEMLIGKSTGFISAHIHSPVPGSVSSVEEIILPNGVATLAVKIELKGEFNRLKNEHDKKEWSGMNKEELLQTIVDRGIVGLGGATFPTNVKYSIPRGKHADYFVVNGVECEPYLTADYRLMLEKTAEIFEGIRIVKKILEPKEIYIGVENNKPDVIDIMRKAAAELDDQIQVIPLEMKYPQGDEKQLLKAILDKEVPSGGLPIDIGAVVSNVGTIFAIYEAVAFSKPLIERIVTVSGKAIKQPGNFKVRIGTTVGNLIDECGGLVKEPQKLVMGGPMMGFAVCDLDTPVTKGTSGILALTPRECRRSARTACIQCGRCIQVCPMGLQPTKLYKNIEHMKYENALDLDLMDCKECGCCGFICPANLPLVQSMRLGKAMAKKRKK
jgi:Na+-translocating ferredoxin:NAD+ oxidoreductase subunit C